MYIAMSLIPLYAFWLLLRIRSEAVSVFQQRRDLISLIF